MVHISLTIVAIILIIILCRIDYKVRRKEYLLKELEWKEKQLGYALADKDKPKTAELQYECRKIREEYRRFNS